MRSWREIRINQELYRFDNKLYLSVVSGQRRIMRKAKPQDYYILALTEDWTQKSPNVDWGIEAIISRLREIDGHNPDTFVNQLDKIEAKRQEAKDRDIKNRSEDFAREFRPAFAKAFDGINTSTLEKKDSRRKKDKNGYR